MTQPISIIELKSDDGSIIELPVLAGDKPEDLANALKKNGFDPTRYQKEINEALVTPTGTENEDLATRTKPDPKNIDSRVADVATGAFNFPAGSTERSRALEDAQRLEKILGIEKMDKMAAGVKAEDIATILNTQGLLKDFLKFKSSGFGGKGIDTGPVIGGELPNPFGVFGEDAPNFIPSGVSEYYNNLMGEGENAADRTELRRKQLSLINPVRKEVTGASAAMSELLKFIFPTLPNESDNDLGFYKKGINSLKESQVRLQALMNAIERSGSADVSGFKDIVSKNPDKVVEDLLKQITENYSLDKNGNVVGSGEYGFGTLMPDTTKKFLKSRDVKNLSDEDILRELNK